MSLAENFISLLFVGMRGLRESRAKKIINENCPTIHSNPSSYVTAYERSTSPWPYQVGVAISLAFFSLRQTRVKPCAQDIIQYTCSRTPTRPFYARQHLVRLAFHAIMIQMCRGSLNKAHLPWSCIHRTPLRPWCHTAGGNGVIDIRSNVFTVVALWVPE